MLATFGQVTNLTLAAIKPGDVWPAGGGGEAGGSNPGGGSQALRRYGDGHEDGD